MIDSETEDDSEAHAWVRSHIIGFFATIGVVIGLVIADFEDRRNHRRQSDASVSHGVAGFGAVGRIGGSGTRRVAQCNRRSAGRIFLTVTGLVLLTGAAFGMSNCLQEIREHLKTRDNNPTLMRDFFPLQTALPGGEESGEL